MESYVYKNKKQTNQNQNQNSRGSVHLLEKSLTQKLKLCMWPSLTVREGTGSGKMI